jgi:hypothetical protein
MTDVSFTFEGDPSAGALVCRASDGSADLTRLQERAIQAVLLMRRVQFDAPLPWTPQSLYDWFVSSVDGVRFRTDISTSFCCEPARVINILSNRQLHAGVPGYPLEVMVHEARHTFFEAHTCFFSKDRRIDELGAFGVQYYLDLWLGSHSNLPQEYRKYFQYRAEALRNSAFCEECQQ